MKLVEKLRKCPKRTGILTGLLIILVLLPFWFDLGANYQEHLIDLEKKDAGTTLAIHSNYFTYALNERLGLIEALYSFIKTNPSKERLDAEFDPFASGIYNSFNGLRNLAASPGGIRHYVYPLEGNEAIIDYNILNDARPEVIRQNKVLFEGQPTVIRGPVRLIQGGEGVIIIKPIFLNGTYENGDFWGFVEIVINMPSMYELSGIPGDTKYDYAIKNDDYGVFYGSEDVYLDEPVVQMMQIGYEQWEIAMIPKGGWVSLVKDRVNWFMGIYLLIITLSGVFGGYVIYTQLGLDAAVDERTSELKKAREDLLFKESAIASSVSPVFLSDKNGKIFYMNNSARKLWGFKERDIANLCISDIFSISDDTKCLPDRVSENKSWTGELEGIRAEGELFPVYGSISPVLDSSGEVAGLHGSFLDISRRKAFEEALRENEYKFREIFNNVNDLIFLNRLNDENIKNPGFVEVNDIACRKLGYSRQEFLSMKLADVVPEKPGSSVPLVIERLIIKREDYFEGWLAGKEGIFMPVYVSARIIRLGNDDYLLSFMRDMTEEKASMKREFEAIRQIEENLVKMAALNDEIRNPLAVIVGYTDLEQGPYTDKIFEQADVIDKLINRLDQAWVESEKIREFMRKYYRIEDEKRNMDKK
ncbi:PAS domain S-box protein [Methanoplanus sp. FWC-SCC4]|uniref:PAS domain S-box protein n=1 Tax=Methanochimaera problematica TaxID=2609417 RepID=A0AA97FG94_9EURY|nr:PAS domain S-box protein [Methanoplanus sp. FWC-SCC4]WOF16881.1 PAS domain S-box protein [Methanoplanus sp. FWC-SCC4]